MIPQQLVLKNFLSYREARLDFRGLHTACICGANGAGKSSLLEAIAWAIWGYSRASTDDDVIHAGATEAQVDFVFRYNDRTYRIIRVRQRGQATTLEFQLAQPPRRRKNPNTQDVSLSFRSLTAKGVRATQHLILEHLKLDYDTFINSAYLRQGRADEFMLKRPTERKQILADLLKLNQYDDLADRAKDRARQLKGQVDLLEQSLASLQTTLQQQSQLVQEQQTLEQVLANLHQQQTADTEQLQQLQQAQHQRQTWHQQLTWHQQQHQLLQQDCQRLQRDTATAQQQHQQVQNLLQQEPAIQAGYAHWQRLQLEDDQWANRFATFQTLQHQRQQFQQQQTEQMAVLQQKIQSIQSQLATLQQQEDELQPLLQKAPDIDRALQQLHQARATLTQLDQRQLQASPLIQRRQQLQQALDRAQARLSARLDELQASAQTLQAHQHDQPQLHQAVLETSDRLQTLEQQRLYQQQVLEKGMERRSFLERLQADQRNCEVQLADIDQKLRWLQAGMATPITEAECSVPNAAPILPERPTYPPCPLCDRPLDDHHWQLVIARHHEKQQEILEQFWVVREQLATSEREIQILRQEYRDLDRTLSSYNSTLQRHGQLQEQLHTFASNQATLTQLLTDIANLEHTLQHQDFATEIRAEQAQIDCHLQQLNYDEKDHALARGEVDRWRWADIKQAELKQARRHQARLASQRPNLESQITTLQQQLDHQQQVTQAGLTHWEQQLADLGYNPDRHNDLRQALKQAQIWNLRYQELEQARQQVPTLEHQLADLAQALQERQQHQQTLQSQIETLIQQLQQTPEHQPQIQAIEQHLRERRTQLDKQLAALGRLQQQQQHLDTLAQQQQTLTRQLETTQRQHRVYHELAHAFGTNGIQAFMIENVLPQLEAETNRILGRLSANQLHVQFVTQRAGKGKNRGTAAKLIDTLDILIADSHGTRPYETYSGGEAFRVNFAIRLALARLLAQRSGTALQLLIVDEGFGTQDTEGCDRLIAAINAIAPDFACILAVTHVPHLKEAFQARIEVQKTEAGSQLHLVA
jgi:exonuclease SbcC